MPDRLAASTWPRPRQHADDTVDRCACGEEAFAGSRERDVVILLTVTSAPCHVGVL
jgi:uncharacterized protein YyaL (SSP411 family)